MFGWLSGRGSTPAGGAPRGGSREESSHVEFSPDSGLLDDNDQPTAPSATASAPAHVEDYSSNDRLLNVPVNPSTRGSTLSPYAFDPMHMSPLNGQGGLEYVFPDNASGLRAPSWGQRLCYGTGVSYLAGLTTGTVWGLREGLQNASAAQSRKLQLNAVLNSVTRRGPFLANSLGSVAFIYNGINGGYIYFTENNTPVNTIGSAIITGLLFKSTAGVRAMALGAAMGALLSTAFVAKDFVAADIF